MSSLIHYHSIRKTGPLEFHFKHKQTILHRTKRKECAARRLRDSGDEELRLACSRTKRQVPSERRGGETQRGVNHDLVACTGLPGPEAPFTPQRTLVDCLGQQSS